MINIKMYYNLINLIKLGYLYKKKTINIRINKTDFQLIKILLQLNIIKFVKKKKFNNFMIYLNYYNNNPIFKNIINLYKPSKISFITLKNLIKFNKNKNVILILSTNKGLMTNFEAEIKKIGGILIIQIWS